MELVNIHKAKTHLSRLVREVEQGKDIVIALSGKPVARLIPYLVNKSPRKPGSMVGQIRVKD